MLVQELLETLRQVVDARTDAESACRRRTYESPEIDEVASRVVVTGLGGCIDRLAAHEAQGLGAVDMFDYWAAQAR
jgi:hypothetical protein